jgi:hypothetical protein
MRGGGAERVGAPSDRRAMDHLSLAFNLAIARPMVFAPVVLGGIISIILDNFWGRTPDPVGFAPFLFFVSIVSIVASVITFLLNFATIDMARDAYMDQPLDLGRSFNYALSRIVTFFVASIVRVIMSITLILIPVASLMTVIIVMDETGIMNAISQAFSVLSRDLGDVIVIIIISIVGYVLLSWAPMLGGLLTASFGVIIDLAFIDVYHQHQREFLAY